MLVAVVVLAAPLLFATAASASATSTTTTNPVLTPMSGSYVFTLTFDGRQRDYRIHVPPAA
jgi:poly(3-hydroxybutyrate) depolymerase